MDELLLLILCVYGVILFACSLHFCFVFGFGMLFHFFYSEYECARVTAAETGTGG